MKVPPELSSAYHGRQSASIRPSERRRAKDRVNELGSESIPHLREAIQSLEHKMATLMSARDMLESKLEQAVRLQSPIQRLPSELLASIFVVGALDTTEEDPLSVSTLMLVCKHWSEVAMDTPILWSRLALRNQSSIERTKFKLARSRSAPLDISIDFNPRVETTGHMTQNVVHAMDILRPSIYRWRSFSLVVSNRPQAHAALQRCREPAPLLQALSVHVSNSMQDDYYSNLPLPIFDGQTPRLRSVSFTSFNFGWNSRLVVGLRVLKLAGYWESFAPSTAQILDILRACPQLEEFSLRNMSDVEPEPGSTWEDPAGEYADDIFAASQPQRGMINLPRLSKLSFYYSGILRTQVILSQLMFPTLEKLELAYLDDITPLLKYLTRQSLTSLPLRYLRVEASFFNELKLMMFLRRVSALATLELVDADDVSSNLLKGLSTPASAQTWICPKLENFELAGCSALDWDSLRTFVESRLPPQSRAFPRQHVSPCPSSSSSPSSASVPLPPVTISASGSMQFATQSLLTVTASSQAQLSSSRTGAVLLRSASASASVSHRWPRRLKSIDLSRCHQITKEMVQWLRVYIPEVKSDAARGESMWVER
ncbi:hypothetical protein NEOLEDRAFT_1069537 [Neolentinus lepideus HHB14362 ss-1]|uniref:F-box domain-containing protein n=1 Tax=Neolentinus lepideus HHB14362 ss-1 TaxID=1314782 RepID=A0A165R6Z5_9AGAM|nr:hypothetical protein NEOLEDRAFT_1069537 [Neolentinus lepideus HHB14362 ss-1]